MLQKSAKTVALLVGGWSAERMVSLEKGRHVARALAEAGYEVDMIDVKKDLQDLVEQLTPRPDVVFNNLHGRGGEDGTIQGVLEMLGIPYTHSGVSASAIGMSKPLTNRIAASIGIRVPENMVMAADDAMEVIPFDPPYVVKPAEEGSSVGVCLVMDRENQKPLADKGWMFGDVMVERYIPGRELTVAVLDGRAQAVTEIVSKTRFFDYEAKYHDGRTEYILPAKIDDAVYKCALRWAEELYHEIGAEGIARCDFRFDDSKPGTEGLYFLEINTQPGLTAQSIGPSQVIYNGMSFVELCSHLVETAKCHGLEQQNQKSGNAAPIGIVKSA